MAANTADVEVFEQAAMAALTQLCAEVRQQQSGSGPATGYAPISEILDTLRIEEGL